MKIKAVLAVLASASVLTLSACGSNSSDVPKGPISEARTHAFKSMLLEFGQMGKIVKGDDTYDIAKFKQLASTFTEKSKEPFKHFQSDSQGNGDALPAIWQKPDDFKTKEAQFHAAVDKLNAAAQSGNLDQIKATYGETGSTCKACHKEFRRPE